MKFILFLALFIAPSVASPQQAVASLRRYRSPEKVARDFRRLLQRPSVAFKPSFQTFISDSVVIEKGFIYTEETERIPVLICKPVTKGPTAFPVVICLHGTGGSKDDESIKDMLYRLVKAGIMGVAIDARYHGERVAGGATKSQQYIEAIIKAWKNADKQRQPHPFYYDTVYDLWRLTDYLITRKDVQPERIGMMGISMGGIETWMAAAVDKRIKVAVPVIAAQSFRWSLAHEQWQGRARTIWKVHQQAASDFGDSTVTKENVQRVWEKLLPGITGEFDCPSMIRLFAPRPLLLLSNEKDQNCPLPGAQLAFEAARRAYKTMKALNKLKIAVTPNEPHRFLAEHATMTIAWFQKWL